jgi:hypothetical protein
MRTVLPHGEAATMKSRKWATHSIFSPLHCCVCGKALGDAKERRARNWLLLCRAEDGVCEYAIGHVLDASLEEIKAGLWVAPIGSDCLEKYPELEHALLP